MSSTLLISLGIAIGMAATYWAFRWLYIKWESGNVIAEAEAIAKLESE